MFVNLKPWDDRKGKEQHAQDVMNEDTKATADIKEARILAIAPPAIPGLGATSGFTFELQQTTSTDNIQQFEAVRANFLPKSINVRRLALAFTFFQCTYSELPGRMLTKKRQRN